MNLPKPPVGAQVDRKKDLVVLHTDAKYRIVESVGGYPLLMLHNNDDIISNEGFLMSETNVLTVKKRLSSFLNTCKDTKFKRWGEVLRAYVKSTGPKAYAELVPYPPLRNILINLTAPVDKEPEKTVDIGRSSLEKEGITSADQDRQNLTDLEKTAKPANKEMSLPDPIEIGLKKTPARTETVPSKKRPTPSVETNKENVQKRVKLESLSAEHQLKNITNQQLLCVIGEYQEQPQECSTKYSFLLESSLRAYHAVKNFFE